MNGDVNTQNLTWLPFSPVMLSVELVDSRRCLHFLSDESEAPVFWMTGSCSEMGHRRTSSASAATLPSAVSHALIASLQDVIAARGRLSAAAQHQVAAERASAWCARWVAGFLRCVPDLALLFPWLRPRLPSGRLSFELSCLDGRQLRKAFELLLARRTWGVVRLKYHPPPRPWGCQHARMADD